jgi:hypothetical protein
VGPASRGILVSLFIIRSTIPIGKVYRQYLSIALTGRIEEPPHRFLPKKIRWRGLRH